MKRLLTGIFFILLLSNIKAQQVPPVDIAMLLSGSFGELRNNHFHSGIDIKTQGVINKGIYSINDGYISRISVSPSGYGLALYITHPTSGQISQYGHLNTFSPRIASYVKQKQYEQETYQINLLLEKDELPVKKGELIAYSGNTGSSGGPHLHFEIRSESSETVFDPLAFYKDKIKDTTSPELRGIAIYPVEGEGVVNQNQNPLRLNISRTKKGQYQSPKTVIQAWGKIGLGVKAYDRMNNTANSYGVKIIRLFVDNRKIFQSDITSFSFSNSRMINSFVDFEDWRKNKSFFMKSFIEPGNKLPFYEAENGGYINIDKQQTYNCRYELEDIYGNRTSYSFSIIGKEQKIPPMPSGQLYLVWDRDNHYLNDSFTLIIPKGNLYKNCIFTLKTTPDASYFTDRFMVNNNLVPLHNQAEIKIKLNTDTLSNKSLYGIVSINGNKEHWIGGSYSNGYITASIRELGATYAVSSDSEAPLIEPVKEQLWEKEKTIKIRLTDNLSGISYFKGTIDGKFALFEHDSKSTIYSYDFDKERLEKGKNHTLTFIATDECGNTTEYVTEFFY